MPDRGHHGTFLKSTMNNWDPEFYKTGYEGYELPENFSGSSELEEYRRQLLEKTEEQVTFIERHVGKRKLRVIEFGSGNGRLLIALALRGLLEHGVGVEISQSRTAFATQWNADLNLPNIRSICDDALTFDDFESESFDLAVCITGAFAYLRPIRESAPAEALAKMYSALAPNGHVLLELYQMPEKRKQMLALSDGKLRQWHPLPPEDSFAYYLGDFEYFEDRKTICHRKTFIGRDGRIDTGRVEVLSYYDQDELSSLLRQQGFENLKAYQDFEDSNYLEGQSTELVLLAQRGAG